MTLQDVFDLLTYGELANMSIGGGEAGIVSEANQPKLIPHVNLGLAALYKIFPLKERRVSFPITTGEYTYELQVDDLNRIEKVFTSTGFRMALNDEGNIYSCFTTSMKVICFPEDVVDGATTLPEELQTSTIEVVYRANHPKLLERDAVLTPAEIELELPYTHLEPLLYFVAARVHSPVGAGQFEGLISNTYWQKYQEAVGLLKSINPEVENTAAQTKFAQRGWA